VRIEVRSALAAADPLAGQGVLEDLLEAEELDDAGVDRGVEAQAALVGAQRGVELDAEAAVDVDLAGVVDPGNPGPALVSCGVGCSYGAGGGDGGVAVGSGLGSLRGVHSRGPG